MAKIKQSNYILKKVQPSGYSNQSKSRFYLLSVFNENYNYILLYLGFFGGANGPRAKVQEVTAYTPFFNRGIGPSKNRVTQGEGVPIFLLERGNKPEKMGILKKWRMCLFFITLDFNHIYCVCKKSKVLLLLFGSSVFGVSHGRFLSKFLQY